MIRDLSTTPSQSTRKCSLCTLRSLRYALRHFPSNILACLHLPYFFQVPYPQLLCLPLLRKLPRCVPTIPILVHPSEARSLRSACFRGRQKLITFPRRSERPNVRTFKRSTCWTYPLSFQILAHSFALFCTLLHSSRTQPIYFQALPHSLPKTPGWGTLATSDRARHLTTKQKQTRAVLHDRFSTSAVLSVVSSRPWPCSSAHPATSARQPSKPGGLYP